MATECSALARVRRAALGDDLRIDEAVNQLCVRQELSWRERLLWPAVFIRLFVMQILHGNTSIVHLRQLSGLDFAPSSYVGARCRLPLAVLEGLLGWLMDKGRTLAREVADTGRRVMIVDCSSFSMPDTPELRKHFGLPKGRGMIKGVAYPVAKLVGLMDAATGMFSQLMAAPLYTHELRHMLRVHPLLRFGDILLGDRAFGTYVHLALLAERGVDMVARLHQRRKGQGGNGIVVWNRPKTIPAWMTREQFMTLPMELTVRLVSYRIEQRGFRTKDITLVTTLLDEQAWPDEAIRDLYRRRWGIETCFDHLKTTMKMAVLKCKTVAGMMKELAAYLLVYNLVRLQMLQAALRQRVDVNRISFVDAARYLLVRLMGLPGVERLIVNPLRPNRQEPRAIRRRPKPYRLMTRPRAELKAKLAKGVTA